MTSPETETAQEQAELRLRRVELAISLLLRSGVVICLALVIFGTILTFLHHPSYVHSGFELQRLASPRAAFPHTLREVVAGLVAWRGQAFVTTGLILLIATPIMRVAISILAFVYQRDRIFVVLTTIVLAVLLLSFVLGKVE